MPSENQIEVHGHQGKLLFDVIKGGYCIHEGKLAVSVEGERLEDGEFPTCAYFCIFDFPVSENLKVGDNLVYERPKNSLYQFYDLYEFEDQPKAHAYFGFHVAYIQTIWAITKIEGDEIWFSMEAIHDDIDQYDGKARTMPTCGTFRLQPRSIAELWIP